MLNPGDRAPAFDLKDVEGAPQSLAAVLERGPAVLVFFKASCPTCQFTMPFVQRISAGGKRFYAISQDHASTTRSFMKQFGLRIPVLLDAKKERYAVSKGFKIDHVPSFFALAQDGAVEKSFTGFVKAELEALGSEAGIDAFRAGEKVPLLKPG